MLAFDLGRIGYEDAFALQKQVQALVQSGGDDILLLLEHPPTVSIGKNSGEENVPPHLQSVWGDHVDIVHSTRGGNVTCHFPGQLVAYPIISLKRRSGGIRAYVHDLEETAIRMLARFGVTAERRQGFPGVWTGEKKIASLGIAVSRYVTMHGLALNVAEDLSLFNIISPCGLEGVAATSMARETAGPTPAMTAVNAAFLEEFYHIFKPAGGHDQPLPTLRAAQDLMTLLQDAQRTEK